jgi:hypothetical protein
MKAKVDLRNLSHQDKTDGLAATGSQLTYLQVDCMMEGPDMALAWQDVLWRGRDKLQPGELTWVDPEVFGACLRKFLAGETADREWIEATGENQGTGLWATLRTAVACKHKAATILLPVHSKNPQHWTLLVLCRPATAEEEEPKAFTVEYFDSLPQPSNQALEQAAASLSLMDLLLLPAQLEQPSELKPERSRKQSDMWSCGYWVMLWCEDRYRQTRGEGCRLVKPNWQVKRGSLNDLIRILIMFKLDRDRKAGILPTTSQPVLPPPPKLGAVLPVVPGKLKQDELSFGCPTCRYCPRGCLHCSQYKAAAYIAKNEKKEAEQAAKGQKQVEDKEQAKAKGQ